MKPRDADMSRGADLRAFRWPLQAFERKLDQALEAARLRNAACQSRVRQQRAVVDDWTARQAAQQRLGVDCVRRDPRLASDVLAYLEALNGRLAAEDAAAVKLEYELEGARTDCAQWHRELACVQALRERAQQAYAQEQARREQKEIDAAWLARTMRSRMRGDED